MARYARKAELFPGIYALSSEIGAIGSIRQFDEKILARYWGFRGADDYYDRAASARVVDRIAVPTLILHAEDDPFIRLLPETRAILASSSSAMAARYFSVFTCSLGSPRARASRTRRFSTS